jgi:hypothetical protein
VGVQEVRWDRDGAELTGEYTFLYGKVNENHELGKHVPAATNAQETIEEMLEPVFSMRSVSYKRKVSDLTQLLALVTIT